MRQKIIRPAPSEISFKEMRFLITDRPTDQTIATFIEVSSPSLQLVFDISLDSFVLPCLYELGLAARCISVVPGRFFVCQPPRIVSLCEVWRGLTSLSDVFIFAFRQELKKHNVKDVVRVCEPTYQVEELRKEGIDVTDLVFDDGTFPPSDIVEQWFDLLRRRYRCSVCFGFFPFFLLLYVVYEPFIGFVIVCC